MKLNKIFKCAYSKTQLKCKNENTLTSLDGKIVYNVIDNIIDFTYPQTLLSEDNDELISYNKAYQRYDKGVEWVFESLNADENHERQKLVSLLDLKPGMRVLEVGAGTGKDSVNIIKNISPGGEIFLSDLSRNMLKIAKQRIKTKTVDVNYFIANGSYLPFDDNIFDAVFHFGGINTFSERKKAFSEFNRVAKPGARVVVGDESVPLWLRSEESFKVLMKANNMFADEIPLNDIPKNIENFQLNYIFGFGYYVISYNKTNTTPSVNVDLQIPTSTHQDSWRVRANINNIKCV